MRFMTLAPIFFHVFMLVSNPHIACGFAFLTSNSIISDKNQKLFALPANDQEENNPILDDVRTKRILLPLQLITSSFFVNSYPAYAGIGSIVPFEVSRKEKFEGSIQNSVVMLRLNSTLRKRRYLNSNAVVATLKSSDDLSKSILREFGKGEVVSLGDPSSFEDYVQKCQDKKAIVLYGQDVSISPEGIVSDVHGQDIKTSEKILMDKLATSGILDLTIVGGIVIHRVKTGGKDAGEDCFFPMAITNFKDGVTTDLFEKVFGDLPTPRQS